MCIRYSAYWGFMYPTDIIKSKIQVDNPRNPLYTGTIDAFVKVARAEGVAGLYRGFTPCMGRAFPANAAQVRPGARRGPLDPSAERRG